MSGAKCTVFAATTRNGCGCTGVVTTTHWSCSTRGRHRLLGGWHLSIRGHPAAGLWWLLYGGGGTLFTPRGCEAPGSNVRTIVLFGGAHKQVRDFVRTSLLRAPLKVHDPVSVQLGKTEDWRPGVVKSRQSFPLGYEVELLETHPVIDGNTTKVSPERIRPRFPDGLDVEVYRGVKLGWFPGVVKASNVDNTEAWPDVVVEMAPHWESDSKEDVTCPSCHVRASQRRPTVKSSAAHTLEQI